MKMASSQSLILLTSKLMGDLPWTSLEEGSGPFKAGGNRCIVGTCITLFNCMLKYIQGLLHLIFQMNHVFVLM